MLMTDERATSPTPTITARPSRDEKARFVQLATRLGVSESTLALNAIRLLLDSNQSTSDVLQPVTARNPATDRITIRLRPGDANAILDRATRRGFKPSAYIAALVRAHLTHNPPLPTKEVLLLKGGLAVLLRLGKLLAHMRHEAATKGILAPELAKELIQTRALVTGLERVTHDLIKAALIAWESKYE
jgi:predicted DNA binding CopG/RHH family protein